MADPIVSKIVENARAQPQHLTFDPVTWEIEVETLRARSQFQQPPNISENNRQRMDPKLLKAIVNGDLFSFKKILGIEEPTRDIETTQVTNDGGNSVLRGVTCRENTALHVVAGIMEKSSRISLYKLLYLFLLYVLSIGIIGRSFAWNSDSVSHFLSLSPIFSLLIYYIIKNLVKKFMTIHFPWIPQKIYEKAKRTRWLKWVLFFYKRRMYMEIAEIIYRQDTTLLDARNCATETPLHRAANAGNLHMVSLLVKFAREEGAQKVEQLLWARNKAGETALHEAARSGYGKVVKELLAADGILSSLEDNSGISPLYLAVAAGCLHVVDKLIAANSSPSYGGPDEQTALHAAAMRREKKENIMRAILNWNPSLAAKSDRAGNTPLHYAALIGNNRAVKELLSKDTGSVYKANKSGSFPVHLAAEAGNFRVIKELLSMCLDVSELLDKEERNFLHVAVQKKRIRLIRLACQEGINANVMNAKDKDGNTPLHLAVLSSESEIFALLSLSRRVNLNIRNKAGLTPLDISASLEDRQFTYSLNPQSIIYRALLTRGAFQNRCQPDLPKIDDNLVKKDDEASVDYPNRRERKEMWNGVEVDIEKESSKYENMSKSLITGAVLIASATFVAICTVSGVYRGDNTSHTKTNRRNFFKAFVIADVLAFILIGCCCISYYVKICFCLICNFITRFLFLNLLFALYCTRGFYMLHCIVQEEFFGTKGICPF